MCKRTYFNSHLPYFLLIGIGISVLLSGCGFLRYETREPWRAEAESMCMRSGLVKPGIYIRQIRSINGPGSCGAELPLRVAALKNGKKGDENEGNSDKNSNSLEITILKPEATLGCPMVAWAEDWLNHSVQPAAIAWFGREVKEIRDGSYACRRRNHQPTAKLSEHSFGNALDIMSFVLEDGYVITVKGGWKGSEQEQGFLREVFFGACQKFKTVLGPGADVFHYDHIHIDLARHDAKGLRRYCKPQISAPKRPEPGQFAPKVNPQKINPWGGPPNAYVMNQEKTQESRHASLVFPRPNVDGATKNLSNLSIFNEKRRYTENTSDPKGELEVEPEFSPSEFDIPTGSISDLPYENENMSEQPLPSKTTQAIPNSPTGYIMQENSSDYNKKDKIITEKPNKNHKTEKTAPIAYDPGGNH